MSTFVSNPTVSTKERMPTPFNNAVSVSIKVPSTETNGLNIYDSEANTDFFTLEPGDSISLRLKPGENVFWEGDGGDCNPQVFGNGW